MERICLLQPHIETETEGTKSLLFINIRSYNERSDSSYIPKNKTDFLTILSLMLSCYFQEKQRSFTSGDFWVLPRWQVTHFQFLSVFQDGGHVKFPTLGKARSVNFPWVDVLLKVGVAEKVVINVPFVATGDLCEPCLPGITNWQTVFWIATFKRLNRSARFPFLLLNKDRLKISSAEPDVQKRERPLRRSLPPQEAEGTPQRRQRRSFHGFKLVNREQDGGYEPDSDPDTEFRTKNRSLPVKTSKIPPKTKPKPKKEKMQQDTSTIHIDENAAAEVVLKFIGEVGEEASKLAGEYIHPGAGDAFQTAFRWIMRLIKSLFRRYSSKEDARDEDEDED